MLLLMQFNTIAIAAKWINLSKIFKRRICTVSRAILNSKAVRLNLLLFKQSLQAISFNYKIEIITNVVVLQVVIRKTIKVAVETQSKSSNKRIKSLLQLQN